MRISSVILIVFTVSSYFPEIIAQGGKQTTSVVRKHDNVVMCYFSSWARYRPDYGFFDAHSFDPNLCTHIIYSFIGLDPVTFTVKSLDPQADLNGDEGGKDGFKSVVNLKFKYPHLKTLVAIGGWTQGSENYSAMASVPERRQAFVQSAVEFINKYKFDGLDVDWEYPSQRGGKPEDKQNFVTLIKDLRSAFKKYNWILSVAVSAAFYVIDEGYDVPQISEHVTYINIMSYDYHGKWDNKTGHNTPLYQRKDGHDMQTNVNASIQRYIALGADRKKINLGLAFGGRTFTLDAADNKHPSVGEPAHVAGPMGTYTQEAGFMGYNELCQFNADGYEKKFDHEQRVPYAFKDKTWMSYDDARSIQEKVNYAVSNELSGVMIWSIDTDDIKGRCHKNQPMYLLKTINEALGVAYEKKTNEVPKDIPNEPDSSNEVDETPIRNESPTIHNQLPFWIASAFVFHIFTIINSSK